MSKKLVLFVILSSAFLLLASSYIMAGYAVERKSPVSQATVQTPSSLFVSGLRRLSPIIKKDVSKNNRGFKKTGMLSKDYRISDDPYMGMSVNIIRFDKENHLFSEASEGSEWQRDVAQEKQQFLSMKVGEHRGNIHIFNEGYAFNNYSVRMIGANKYIVVYEYSPSGGTYCVNYTTFKDDAVMEISYYMQDEGIKPVRGVGGNIALIMAFKEENKEVIKEMDVSTGKIF